MTQHACLLRVMERGPVRRKDHPDLLSGIDAAVKSGELVAVLPGTYLSTIQARQDEQLLRAAMVWDLDAVVTGRHAAARQFWPNLERGPIELALPKAKRVRPDRYRLTERRIPSSLIGSYQRIRCTRTALTAIDLCAELGSEVIDRALRSRKVTPAGLRHALGLTRFRDGNTARRAEILNSAGNPWSYAERKAHTLLRNARITGWRGNPRMLVRGSTYYPDVLFDEINLIVEIDGLHHARNDEVYQSDLWRMNDFQLEGYHVLRYTLADLERSSEMFIDEVREMQARLTRIRKRRAS